MDKMNEFQKMQIKARVLEEVYNHVDNMKKWYMEENEQGELVPLQDAESAHQVEYYEMIQKALFEML